MLATVLYKQHDRTEWCPIFRYGLPPKIHLQSAFDGLAWSWLPLEMEEIDDKIRAYYEPGAKSDRPGSISRLNVIAREPRLLSLQDRRALAPRVVITLPLATSLNNDSPPYTTPSQIYDLRLSISPGPLRPRSILDKGIVEGGPAIAQHLLDPELPERDRFIARTIATPKTLRSLARNPSLDLRTIGTLASLGYHQHLAKNPCLHMILFRDPLLESLALPAISRDRLIAACQRQS